MYTRAFPFSTGWATVLMLLSTACNGPAGKEEPVDEPQLDTDLPVDPDTPVVDEPDPDPVWEIGEQAAVVSGTAQGFSENYRARIVIGQPATHVERQSTTYRATVGIGTVQPSEVTP